jgi:hypothetical protein
MITSFITRYVPRAEQGGQGRLVMNIERLWEFFSALLIRLGGRVRYYSTHDFDA